MISIAKETTFAFLEEAKLDKVNLRLLNCLLSGKHEHTYSNVFCEYQDYKCPNSGDQDLLEEPADIPGVKEGLETCARMMECESAFIVQVMVAMIITAFIDIPLSLHWR